MSLKTGLLRRVFEHGLISQARRLAARWQKASEEEIAAEQLARLRECWAEATRHVPYYRHLVEQGQAPRDFASLREFRKGVPVLTRRTLVEQRDAFRRDVPPDYKLMTAGACGVPLRFGTWRGESVDHTDVNRWVARLNQGMGLGDRVFFLWGPSRGRGRRASLPRWRDAMLGYRRADAFHLDAQSAQHSAQAMLRFRPRVIVGYACALDMWARANRLGLPTPAVQGVKFCIAGLERLPQPDSREVIGRFLGCPVVMEYGGVDFGVCAHEMGGAGRYRVFWWSHLLEVEGDKSDGPLLVTNLTERYLPLFRYRNGDACEDAALLGGGQVVSFADVADRTRDGVRLPDGRLIHGSGLFQCIQQEPVHFIQLVVRSGGMRVRLAAPGLPSDVQSRVRRRLGDCHPDLAKCAMDLVEDVATTPGGRRRWIVYE